MDLEVTGTITPTGALGRYAPRADINGKSAWEHVEGGWFIAHLAANIYTISNNVSPAAASVRWNEEDGLDDDVPALGAYEASTGATGTATVSEYVEPSEGTPLGSYWKHRLTESQ
jgi:hypothetical protein